MSKMTVSLLLVALLFCTAVSAIAPIYVTQAVFAESIAWSSTTGIVVSCQSCAPYLLAKVASDGTLTSFINEPRATGAAVLPCGVAIDTGRNQIVVVTVNSTSAFGGLTGGFQGAFVRAALDTGAVLQFVDFSSVNGTILSNDLTVDSDGNWYISDSSGGRILKVTTDGVLSVFAADDRLKPTTAAPFGIDGIAYVDGFLIAANLATGLFYRVPINNPTAIQQLTLSATVTTPDGVHIGPDGNLYAVENASPCTIKGFKSTDNWMTATLISTTASNYTDGSGFAFYSANSAYVSHSSFPPTTGFYIDSLTLIAGTTTTSSTSSGISITFNTVTFLVCTVVAFFTQLF